MTVTGPSFTDSTRIMAPKRPPATAHAGAPQFRGELVDQRFGDRRVSGRDEARAAAFAHIGEQRELRDDERLAAGVDQRAVEAASLVGEQAQFGALAGHPARPGGVVALCDADEHEETRTDGAHDVVTDGDTGPGHTLQDDAHRG